MLISEIFLIENLVIHLIQVILRNVVTELITTKAITSQDLMEEEKEVNANFGVKEDVSKEIAVDFHTFNFVNIKISAVTMRLVFTYISVNKSLF